MKVTRRNMLGLAGAAIGTRYTTLPNWVLAAPSQQAPVRAPYKLRKLIHGVAYYPELWPESDIDRDISEMQALGINVARMGEFAWSSIEPSKGKINLNFFKHVMDKLHKAGIGVVLCTPTATPPIWLTHNHPERCHKNADGEVMIHGARQHASYEHPEVKRACFKIIKALSQTLGKHPALIAWQLDNEMKAHVAEDFSDAAIAAWHQWLKNRFGNIDNLNNSWGTQVWSQYYQKFEQVPAPFKTPFLHSASLSTAYKIFCREQAAAFLQQQSAVIKQYSDQPITHNDNPAFNLDHEKSMLAQDFASYDAYPTAEQWGALVFRSDLYRAAIPGRPFWLMETSSSHNGWLGNHQPPHPRGYLVAEAALVYALGGEAFCYWLWRQQRSGAELSHSAIMNAWFKPGIGYQDVKKVEVMRRQLEPLLVDSVVAPAEIAITYSDHARAMIETEPMDEREGFPKNYRGVIEFWHAAVRDLGYHRDVRFEGAGLEHLKLLITPAMPYLSSSFVERIMNFVEAGGVWIAGPLTGTRTKEHTVPTDAGLGLLDALAGVTTHKVIPLTHTASVGRAFNMAVPLGGWCATLSANAGTLSIGKIEKGVGTGSTFISERALGKGLVVVLSAQPDGNQGRLFLNTMLQHYARKANVKQHFPVSPGTILAPRVDSNGAHFWVAVNMDGKSGTLKLPQGAFNGVTRQSLPTALVIKPYEWQTIIFNQPAIEAPQLD